MPINTTEADNAYEAFLEIPVDEKTGRLDETLWDKYTMRVCNLAIHMRQVASDRTDGIFVADFRDGSAIIVCNTLQRVERGVVVITAGRKKQYAYTE